MVEGTGETLAGPPVLAAGSNPPLDYAGLGAVDTAHYVVVETVAQGGMGRVLRAHDRRLGRDVAIKELVRQSPELAARFEREVRITAALQHPSIVTVHEAGTWQGGEPFYAMELVSGRPLDAVARDAKTPTERVALVPHVIAVAEALAYAHSRGVIHRDLKPSNVIVGEFGETVVIDWGLAKDVRATSDTTPLPAARGSGGETMFGAVVGTPAFMPPEQARGDKVDERADVYAIGAMLYAVLAGHAPFEGPSADAILDRVIDDRPRPLAQLVPEAPADLVAIVDKAMARVPQNRYADARELARDLRRFQTGQLVGARRYTLRQRLWRFVAKYRAVVGVAALALVVIGVLAGISVRRIVDERDHAEAARALATTERTHADTERARADTERGGAEGLVGFMLTELKPKLARVGRLDVMGAVARHVEAYYSALPPGSDRGDPAAIVRRATALQVLGDVLVATGDSPGGNRAYRAAIALATGHDAAFVKARAQTELAASLLEDGQLDGARALLDEAHAALAAMPDHAVALATVERRLGTLAFLRGKLEESLAHLARCIELGKPVVDDPAHRLEARVELAKCYDRYSDAESARSNDPGAEAAAHSGLELRQAIAKDDPGDLDAQHGIAVSWDKLVELARAANKPADASVAAKAGLAAIEPLAERDPDNADWQRQLAISLERFAELASDAKHQQAAALAMVRPIAILDKLAASDPTSADRAIDVFDALDKQGGYFVEAHAIDAGLGALHRALALAEQTSARVPTNAQYQWSVASVHGLLGEAYVAKVDYPAAVTEFRARQAVDAQLVRGEPTNSQWQLNEASDQFRLGDALASTASTFSEGVSTMVAALAALHRLRDAGMLSPRDVSDLAEQDAHMAQIQAQIARGH